MTDAQTLRDLSRHLSDYAGTFLPATKNCNGFSEEGVARKVVCALAVALHSAAKAIETRSAETEDTGSARQGESAVPKGFAQ